jgi:hypothetical protein
LTEIRVSYPLALTYSGDVFDTPPPVLRVVLGAICLLGAVLVLVRLIASGQVPALIVVVGTLGIAEYLIATVPTAAGVTWSTIAFGAVIAACALFIPM